MSATAYAKIIDKVAGLVSIRKTTDPELSHIREANEAELQKILELILTPEELEFLEIARANKEVLDFVVKNKDMLKKTKKIRGILRVPQEGD
jgi:hypothetical protein